MENPVLKRLYEMRYVIFLVLVLVLFVCLLVTSYGKT
jgi:hypothetical protein